MATLLAKPSLLGLLAYGFVAYLFYRAVIALNVSRQRAALARARGCLPAPKLPQQERIFGYQVYKNSRKSFKERRVLDYQTNRWKIVGANTFSQVVLGRQTHQTIEPENLKHIMAVEAKNFSLGKRRIIAFSKLLGTGIFTSDGQDWAHSREMLRPNFVRAQVADLDMFETHVSHLIKLLPRDGSTVNLADYFFRLTMDSSTEFLFGESTGTLTSSATPHRDDFAGAFNRSQEHIAHLSRMGFFAKFTRESEQVLRDRQTVWGVVDAYVKKGLAKRAQLSKETKSDSERYVFIDELVRQTDDPIRIRSELLNILVAGRDTTASLLTNVVHTLSKRPDIWSKLQAEVAELNGAPPNYEQIKSMKYIRAILNESLRLYPVVPFNSRMATKDLVLPLGGGPDGKSPLLIPKNGTVVWGAWAMHRRKDLYGEDAEEFRPERWIDDPVTGQKGLRPGWEYLPFNGGARICLGQQFALTEASYTIIRLCQVFEGIESRDPNPWTESLTLTLVNLHGAKVSLTPRTY